jgi:hypothetical protein
MIGVLHLFPRTVSRVLRGLTPLLHVFKPRFGCIPINWKNIHPDFTPRCLFNLLDAPPPPVAKDIAQWAKKKEWRMMKGQLDVGAGLQSLRVPLFALFGVADPLISPETASAFVEALPHDDKRMRILGKAGNYSADYSHVDIAFGRNAAEEVYQPIATWLAEHPIDTRSGAKAPRIGKKPTSKKRGATKKVATEKRKSGRGKKSPARRRTKP